MELIVIWVVLAAIVGAVASSRGRNGGGWFLISLLLSPLIGLILVAVLPAQERTDEERRPCPRCGEGIMRSASVCHFCGVEVIPMPAPSPSPPARWPVFLVAGLVIAGIVVALANAGG